MPGTRQAQEALVANQIPTTARVDRSSTKFALQTDGEPKLVAVSGTSLQYVLNASAPVIRVDDKSWYACQDGVWFVATSMNGPWLVADTVPSVIYTIPPSSPIYYVTYVRVYQATPTYVYVGYTPGYMGAVVAPGGVVVYGTGYYYSPWVGRYWYGYPVTYGMGVGMAWTPWTGWAFGFGYGWPYGASVVPPAGAMVGPVLSITDTTCYGGMTAWGPGGWATTTGNIYGHRAGFSTVQRGATGYNAFTGNQWATRYGTAYNSTTGTLITGQKGAVKNVYTGNYATGSRGTAVNTKTGASVSGGKVTVGNAYTGKSTTVGGVTASRPGEPPRSAVGVEGRQRWSDRRRRSRRQAGIWNQGWRSVSAYRQRPVGAGHAAVRRQQTDADFEQQPPGIPLQTTTPASLRLPSQLPAGGATLPPPGNFRTSIASGKHGTWATSAPTASRDRGPREASMGVEAGGGVEAPRFSTVVDIDYGASGGSPLRSAAICRTLPK